MKLDWRASAFAAGAAFLLSILAGIISGVPFGALVVRAILGAVVFAAGAAGVSALIDRYLPDLKQSLANPGAPSEAAQSGRRVDIVVDDEPFGGDSGGFELEETDERGETSARGAGGDENGIGDADEADVGELESADDEEPSGFTPGLAAERVHAGGADGDGAPQRDDAGGDDRARAPEEMEEAMPEVASAGSLPDIEGFSGSFSEPGNGGGGAEEEGPSGSSDDASTMARAIRTVLKREQ